MSATCLVPAPVPYVPSPPAVLTRNSGVVAISIRILAAGGLFLSHLVLMRGLGVSGFGEYSLAIASLHILTGLGKLGLDNASLRYVSEYVTHGEFGKLRGFIRDTTRVSMLASITVMLGIMLTAFACRAAVGDRLAGCLMVGALMIPPIVLRQVQEARLRAVGRLMESQIGTAIWPMTLFVMSAILWQSSSTGFSSLTAICLHLISLCAVSVLVYRFQLRIRFYGSGIQASHAPRRQWANTALAFLVAELLISLKSRVCITLAGMMLDYESAGLYGAMEKFGDASLLASQSLGLVIAPQFAALFAAGRFLDMRRLLWRGQLLGALFTFPIAIGIALFGNQLFALLGSSYREGWHVLLALLVSSCILSFSGPTAIVLQMTGRERTMLWITAISAATNILLSMLLMQIYGVLGLGFAQIATSLVWTVGVQLSLSRHPAWTRIEADSMPGDRDVVNEISECD